MKVTAQILLLFSALPAFANMDARKCAEWVQSKPFMSVCGGPGMKDVTCEQLTASKEWVCRADDSWPSSECKLEIRFDQDCNFNKSSIVIKDGREDL